MVYCSGQVGVDPKTGKMVEGSVKDRTVSIPLLFYVRSIIIFWTILILIMIFLQRQILLNLNAVLEAGGSSLQDAIKVNIFLADMADFPAVNEVYNSFFVDPKPVSHSSVTWSTRTH